MADSNQAIHVRLCYSYGTVTATIEDENGVRESKFTLSVDRDSRITQVVYNVFDYE